MSTQKSGVAVTVEDVTPAVAERWLGKNERNRHVRQRLVDAYARDMEAGNWHLTGEAVKFSRNGRLIDGQHRCLAVVQAGTAVKMVVVRGLEEDVQEVIDSGAARTAGDALRMRGITYYSSLAAASRIALLYEVGSIDGSNLRPTHSEILDFVDNNPDLAEAVEMAVAHRQAIDVPQSVLSLAIWRLKKVDPDDAYLFISQLAEKTDLKAGDAVLALLNRLVEVRRNGRIMSRNDYLSLVFRAWNKWRSGEKIASLPIRGREGGAVDVPEPK